MLNGGRRWPGESGGLDARGGAGVDSEAMSQHTEFRRLRDDEEPLGYQVLEDTIIWQRVKGIMLWDRTLPRETYLERQRRGENCGLFVDGDLAAVVSLVAGVPDYWRAQVDDPGATWLCTLAVAEGFHGRGIGEIAMREAVAFLQASGRPAVWLDCKVGFLSRFYEALGFEAVTQQRRHIPHAGGELDCVLFRKLLSQKNGKKC